MSRQLKAIDREDALRMLEQRGYVDVRLRDVSNLDQADPDATLMRPDKPQRQGLLGADDSDFLEGPPDAAPDPALNESAIRRVKKREMLFEQGNKIPNYASSNDLLKKLAAPPPSADLSKWIEEPADEASTNEPPRRDIFDDTRRGRPTLSDERSARPPRPPGASRSGDSASRGPVAPPRPGRGGPIMPPPRASTPPRRPPEGSAPRSAVRPAAAGASSPGPAVSPPPRGRSPAGTKGPVDTARSKDDPPSPFRGMPTRQMPPVDPSEAETRKRRRPEQIPFVGARDAAATPVRGLPALYEAVEAVTAAREDDEPDDLRPAVRLAPRHGRVEKPVNPHTNAMPALDRMAFFGYLANMVSVGIPVMRGLNSMQEQFLDRRSRAVTGELGARIGSGDPLSTAMATMPLTFTRLQIGSVRAGETAGNLPDVLTRLSHYEERNMSLTRHVRSLLVYPMVVFVAALLLIVGLTQVLLSGIAPVLESAKVKMNWATALMLALVKAMHNPFVLLLMLCGLGVAIWYLRRWMRTPRGSALVDRAVMRVPIVGDLIRKIEITRMCESLATLYGSGLPLLQCLEVTEDSCGNIVGREALNALASDVRMGRPIWDAMARTGFFSRSVVQMVNVGEESGTLESMLGKIAQYNDLEVRTALEQFAAAIEPVMIVGLGIVVTIIVLVAFAPLYQLISAMG